MINFSSASPLCLRRLEGIARAAIVGGLRLVLCDDYLDPRISSVNTQALEDRVPLFLLKPRGPKIWVGPLIVPGRTACWHCLRHRLVENRWRDHQAWRDGDTVFAFTENLTPATAEKLSRSVIKAIQDFVSDGESPLMQSLCLVAATSGIEELHPVARRSRCEACHGLGRPRLWTNENWMSSVRDRLTQHYSSVTGILSDLKNISGNAWLPVRIFSCECILPLDPRQPLMGEPPERCVGRGVGLEDATLRCLAEGIERYSSFFQDDANIKRDTIEALGASAVDPRSLAGVAANHTVLANPDDASACCPTNAHRIAPVPYDPSKAIDWVLAEGLGNTPSKWVPAAYVYLRHLEPGHTFCVANSSGCAAGPTLDDATASALLEVIEREAVAIWWYHRIPRPQIPWSRFLGTWLEQAPALFQRQGLCVWLLDLTHDWGLPVVAAVCSQPDGTTPAFASACASSLKQAAEAAVTELVQTVIGMRQCDAEDAGLLAGDQTWLHINEHTFVLGEKTGYHHHTPELECSLPQLVQRAEALALPVYRVDLTCQDIGVPTVRIVVPGMASKHWVSIPAPSPSNRLVAVPRKLGWIDHNDVSIRPLNLPLR